MQASRLLFLFLSSLIVSLFFFLIEVKGLSHHLHHDRLRQGYRRPNRLFVFGDSYVDTGNTNKSSSSAWHIPYGITFPGKPSGRFSDGRVLTDYISKFLRIRSPVSYKRRKESANRLVNGMNFAIGGSGVFHAFVEPNMSTQIDYFRNVIKEYPVFAPKYLKHSISLVNSAGNDYNAYLYENKSLQDFQSFIPNVVNQLLANLKRIYDLGVPKLAVSALPPLGCVPEITSSSSYKKCNETVNNLTDYHNYLLQQGVGQLNNQTKKPAFFILDLKSSFLSVLNHTGHPKGSSNFNRLLEPCCVGKSSQYSCGSLDDKGAKMYTLCKDPTSAFFWDNVHPTQAGWLAVYSVLHATLVKELN